MPVHFEGSAEEMRALDAYVKLSRALSALEMRLAARGAYGKLTPTQFGVLEALLHLGPLSQGELSAKLLKSGGNLTFVVDNLARQGLVERDRDSHDRRRVVVRLTESGRACVTELFPTHLAHVVAEFAVLTPEEQLALARLCRTLGKKER